MAKKTGADAERQVKGMPPLKTESITPGTGLSSGSTLLNLAMSGRPDEAFYPGTMYLLVGASDTGKSVLTMTCFAEAVRNKAFVDYRLLHDNAERGVLLDVERYYGKKTKARVESVGPSATVEDFYQRLDGELKRGPLVYVLDSMDALDTQADQDKFRQHKKAKEEGTKAKGSFGTAKAKLNSSGLRTVWRRFTESGSILIAVSQARDNIDPFTSRMNPQTRGGGRALKFYCRGEMWTSHAGDIRKKVRGQWRSLGVYAKIAVRKNHQTGRKVDVEVPIYWSLGIDDVGSCIDYLLAERHWRRKKGEGADDGPVLAPEFAEGPVTVDELIGSIEGEGREGELRALAARVWREVQREITPDRPMRYGDN